MSLICPICRPILSVPYPSYPIAPKGGGGGDYVGGWKIQNLTNTSLFSIRNLRI